MKNALSQAASSILLDGRLHAHHAGLTSVDELEATIETVVDFIRAAPNTAVAQQSFRDGHSILQHVSTVRQGCAQTEGLVDGLKARLLDAYYNVRPVFA